MSAVDRTRVVARRTAIGLAMLALSAGALPASTAAVVALPLTLVQGGYSSPIFVTNAGDARLFAVEQGGRIKIVGGGTFLDLSGVVSPGGGERGLLGLAFHPNYASNGLFFVDYTRQSDGATVIAEYRRSNSDPNQANPSSGRVVLVIGQPYSNHNGGWIGFKGQYLYIAMGDGGSGGDPGNRAQDLGRLLGKILRINPLDPDGSGSKRYSIPGDNPFVGIPGKDAIWAYGVRNPWRCSFDRFDGALFCGDVGQDSYEEIDRVLTGRGVNFGWHLLEGTHLYPSGDPCTIDCKTLPIADYTHGANGCAVTGGYVSRPSGAPMAGQYVFGDYCSGKVWVIPANFVAGSALPAPADTGHNISSFGEDNAGRLYLVDLNGSIYRLDNS